MSDEIEKHNQALMGAFALLLQAEGRERAAKTKLAETIAPLQSEVTQSELAVREAWIGVRDLMNETGEVEVILPGVANDYKIGWNKQRESVIVESVDALPDEYVKLERKAKLKEIGEHLKGLRDGGLSFPNWARLEMGESKLVWKAVKKTQAA
ncbi:MAG: hypothetical protein SGI88_03645 [Candidatus Hydrogenedentes bacterium]|nr:hypothetical protein [Candidatus Hydrogenedentota bacterium]